MSALPIGLGAAPVYLAIDSDSGFGTVLGTVFILALILATFVIFRMMSGSLRRMRSNVREHPENFGTGAEHERSGTGEGHAGDDSAAPRE